MVPDRIAATIADFLSTCHCPALLEPGEKPLVLVRDHFRMDTTPRGLWLEAWDDGRFWSRKILSAGTASGKKLRLEAFRFGKANVAVTLVDVADSRTAPAIDKSNRSAFAEQFRLFLHRQFGGWRCENFRSEAKLENSFSPTYPSALYTRGQEAVAAIAAPDRDTSFHALSFALVWLDWIRRWHGEICSRRLLLYLPEAFARPVVLLARELDRRKVDVEIWLYAADGGEYQLDTQDLGNLETTLLPRYSRLGGPAWWQLFVGQFKAVDTVEEADGSISYRVRGLEFARLRVDGRSGANSTPMLEFGVKRKRSARQSDLPVIEALIQEILSLRHHGAIDRANPVYLAMPERWLESQVRRNLNEIDACLDPVCVYGQSLGSLHGERSAVDLLAIDSQDRLALLELKATEDIHLPLQAFDYWLRIRQHLAAGDFAGSGYFPGRQISGNAPRIFLVAPSLHFHPSSEAILQWLPPGCEIVRVGVNASWRQRIDAVMRM